MSILYKRLDNKIKPINYKLVFDINIQKSIFKGTEDIEINLEKSRNSIPINTKELKVLSAYIKQDEIQLTCSIREDKQNQITLFDYGKKLIGSVVLHVKFEGINRTNLYGFYKCNYINNGKKEQWLSSQFENTDARAAFPCFDEPAFKSTYEVTMVIDKDYTALSNMPVKSTTLLNNGRKSVSFMKTPIMSSYLLYLGVGKYDIVEGKYNNTILRVITTPGKGVYANLALKYAKLFLGFYEEYFGINFPLPKIDFIAVPDFAVGGMENWGAITFRESMVLGDETASLFIKSVIADTIAHELAHQWFGDLVTMKWWDDIWLNESFAEFMSTKPIDKYFPMLRMKENFYSDKIKKAMSEDQLKGTQPIHVQIKTNDDISASFGGIIYQKGASILNMIEDLVGSKAFREGLHEYLNKHKYKNADRYDLWNAIENSAKRNGVTVAINKIVKDWIMQEGFPVVYVSKKNEKVRIKTKKIHANAF